MAFAWDEVGAVDVDPVTAEMAVRFGKLFGSGFRFWMNLQRACELAIAERTVDVSGVPTLEAGAS